MDNKDVQAVAAGFARLIRLSQRARNRGKSYSGIDHNGFVIVKMIVTGVASRASDIGHAADLDPSIVTRQVHQLIDAGLVERFADPLDGRASLLRCTDAGNEFYESHRSAKESFYRDVFEKWTEADIADLANLLTRLNTDIESALQRDEQQSPHQE